MKIKYTPTFSSRYLKLDASNGDFEVVSRNIATFPYSINYSGNAVSSIVYDLGGGQSITKTFNYSGSDVTSEVLSGDTPSGASLTKTFNYTGGDITNVSYS